METLSPPEPLSRPATSWRSELGSLKAQGLPDDDGRVRACRGALAYWKVRHALEIAKADLSPAGIDLLTAQLLGLR